MINNLLNRYKQLFSIDNIKTVLKLAFPAMTENILQVLLGIVDTYFIARLGTEAIAGVGATNLIMNLYIAFFTALGVGTTAMVARNVGAGNDKKAWFVTQQSIILSLTVGLIMGMITLLFADNILGLLGVKKEVIKYALPYFKLVAVPAVLLALMLVLSSALRGAGDTKTPMKVTLIINILNAVLDYILIFGIFGFNGLGIVGAGLATSISRLTGVIIIIAVIYKGKVTLEPISGSKLLKKDIIKGILTIGSPAAGEKLIMRIGQLVYSAMIIKIGTEAYAAHNIAGSIESLSYMPGYGFAIAASTLVGQNLGAEELKKAEDMGILSNLLGTVVMVSLGAAFFIFARPLGLIFTQEELVLNQVVKVLKIIALVQPALSITLVITAALQGAGDTKFPMYSTLVGIWGIRVTGVYFLGLVSGLGLVGVWLAVAVDLILRGGLLLARFKKGKWKEIKI